MALTNNLSALTELEAVNAMLSSIGEAPIADVESATQADVVTAVNILRNTTREVQSWGWRFNTDWGLEVLPSGTFNWTDSNGITTTLQVFRPPANLAAFEMAMGPTQQGTAFADAVLRPAPAGLLIPPAPGCITCLDPQTDGVASSGLSGLSEPETNGVSSEDYAIYGVANYATFKSDNATSTHGYREQELAPQTAGLRTRIVQNNLANGGHRALRGTRTAADVAAYPTGSAAFGPSYNKPIAANGFLVNVVDVWGRLRFQFSPGYLFGGDKTIAPRAGTLDGKFYLWANWTTTGSITQCWTTNGNLIGVVTSEAEDRLRSDKVPYVYLEIQALGYGDRHFPLMPVTNITTGTPKEFSWRIKRDLTTSKKFRVQLWFGDAWGTPKLIWDTEQVSNVDWGVLYTSLTSMSYDREDLAPSTTSKCFEIIEWETIRGLDHNNPFGLLPTPKVVAGTPNDYLPTGGLSFTGTAPGEMVFWDRVRNRAGFDALERAVLYIDAQWAFGFEQIPQTARAYVLIRAARRLQQQAVGSGELSGFSAQDEQQALRALKRDQGEVDDLNILDNMDVYRTIGGRPLGESGVYDPRSEAGRAR